MKNQKAGKKTAVTVIAVLIVLALVTMCFVFSDYSLSANQKTTMIVLLLICGGSVLYCFVTGEITKNYSQMDKLWSILPVVYAWVIAARGGMKARLVVFAGIVTVWGIRLTVNFGRKGAYSLKFWTGKEDYRWSIVHQFPIFRSQFAWSMFDLFFISLYQNLLVLAICFPALSAMESEVPFGIWDVVSAVLALAFLALETAADEYQWKFHQNKKKLLAEKGTLERLPSPYDLGFNTTGPWGRMRHPNYLGEQGIWMSLYVMAIGAGVTRFAVFHWSMAGPLLLILLFMGSSALGESISAKKYPAYEEYVKQVYKYVPIHRFRRGNE